MLLALAETERSDAHARARSRHAAQDVLEYGFQMVTIAVIVLLGVNAIGYQMSPWFKSLVRTLAAAC